MTFHLEKTVISKKKKKEIPFCSQLWTSTTLHSQIKKFWIKMFTYLTLYLFYFYATIWNYIYYFQKLFKFSKVAFFDTFNCCLFTKHLFFTRKTYFFLYYFWYLLTEHFFFAINQKLSNEKVILIKYFRDC